MRITGQRTRSMFDRYSIVDQADVRRAIQQREAYARMQLADAPLDTSVVQ
jgi:hypothetical protein